MLRIVMRESFAIKWFDNRLKKVRVEVESLMKEFKLSEALKVIYSLIWDDFCSWYLEWIKPGFEEPIAKNIYVKSVTFFTDLLQLLHPFMPFITEEIYHLLDERNDDLIIKQFSDISKYDETVLQHGSFAKELISAIRDARNKHGLKPKETIKLYIETENRETYKSFEKILFKQSNAENIIFSAQPETSVVTMIAGEDKIYIEANKQVDTAAQKEKLTKDLDYLKGFLNSIDKKLSNDRFVQNAKAELIELERRKKSDAEAKIRNIQESLSSLS